MGILRKQSKIRVGDQVRVHRQQNRLGNYIQAEVIAVTQDLLSKDTGLNAEKNILFAVILRLISCGFLPPRSFTYDVRYQDGFVEQHVSRKQML